MKGLLPKVNNFCDQKVNDPFNTEARTLLSTIDDMTKLIKWAENCL